jgi:hypothetical protein
LLVVVLVGTTACGASYRPRPGPRIVQVDRDFQRDGRTFRIGPMGGGAEELVAGNTRAIEYARRKQSLALRGWLVYGLGLATIIAGPIAATAATSDKVRTPLVFSALGVGAGLATLGITWEIQGNAALLDAVNVYNDDVDASRAAPGGAP